MCEVFSIIGASILGTIGVTGASAAAATAVGVGATALGGAALGAGVGAASAAITGGNIGKGALFGAIGGGIFAPIGAGIGGAVAGASAGAGSLAIPAAVGGAISGTVKGAFLGGVTGAAVQGIRASKQAAASHTSLEANLNQTGATERIQKTATTTQDKSLIKRTLGSLRIPLNKTSGNVGLNTGEATLTTGLNIA